MHVLMFSIDDRVFEAGSEARERITAYGPLFNTLHVLVFTRRDREPAAIGANVRLYPARAALTPPAFIAACRQGSRILKSIGRDTVITSQEAFTSLVAFALRWRFRIPVRVEIHTDFLSPHFRGESGKNYLRYLIYRWSVKRADCLRVVSERVAHSLLSAIRSGLPPSAVLPVFVDVRGIAAAVPAFNLRSRYAGFHPIVLWVGRLTGEKNPGLALEVMAEFTKGFPKALLVVVGDGPERKSLELKVQRLTLNENVHFEGWQRDLVPYYKGADAFLVTSRYEGYGRMFVEAAAAGLPIVSTDVGIIGELLKPEEGVFIFRTPEEGRAALLRLLGDHELYTRLRENARRAVRALPDFPAYLEAYRVAVSGCPKR